jgi:hypothetical protein
MMCTNRDDHQLGGEALVGGASDLQRGEDKTAWYLDNDNDEVGATPKRTNGESVFHQLEESDSDKSSDYCSSASSEDKIFRNRNSQYFEENRSGAYSSAREETFADRAARAAVMNVESGFPQCCDCICSTTCPVLRPSQRL